MGEASGTSPKTAGERRGFAPSPSFRPDGQRSRKSRRREAAIFPRVETLGPVDDRAAGSCAQHQPISSGPHPPHDRVNDWLAELQRLTDSADLLPARARAAVIAVIDSYAEEDDQLAPAAAQARAVLTGTPAEPDRLTAATPPATSLLASLHASLPRERAPRPAPTAA